MRKGQAAMEYLMTYGWAILIVIVVVAALYAMGVFKIGGTMQPCSPCFGSQFTYIDYANGILKLRTGPREINGLELISDQATSTIYLGWPNGSATAIRQGTTLTLGSDTNPFVSGTTYELTLSYHDTDSDLNHTETATLRA